MSTGTLTLATESPSPVFVPTHPFANAPGADVILRSSDGAEFHLNRAILSLVSPVFRDVFTLPQPASAAEPVVELQEGSSVLDGALRFFYPGAQPTIATLGELGEMIEVLISKYDMECIMPTAKHHLEKYIVAEPLAVYVLAVRYRWKDMAVAAARSASSSDSER